MTTDAPATPIPPLTKNGIELTGLETIAASERRGRPSGLFWPWFAANVSVFAIAYGAYVLGIFGISFWRRLRNIPNFPLRSIWITAIRLILWTLPSRTALPAS